MVSRVWCRPRVDVRLLTWLRRSGSRRWTRTRLSRRRGLGVQGHYGMEEFKIREGLSVAVNVANGNLVVRSTDLKFNGPGIGTSWD